MQFSNPFLLPTDEYQRDIDVVKHYIDDAAKYISVMTGDPFDQCRDFVKASIKSNAGPLSVSDPTVVFLERKENGDRFETKTRLSSYLSKAIKRNRLIAPTLTTYLPSSEKKSLLTGFVRNNIKKRNKAKKEMFAAEMANDTEVYAFKKNEQRNTKLSNNALSGAHASSSTPLHNKTAHSTLTSTCRSTAGYGNANNEKLLNGNRHYWSPEIVRANIISVVNHTDYVRLLKVMQKYNLHFPTVEETMACIKYSAELYWRSRTHFSQIEKIIKRLTDIERAAFVYTGDLYHLMKLNEGFVRKFIGQLSSRIEAIHPDPDSVFKNLPEDYTVLARQICVQDTKGLKIEDLKKTQGYAIVASTAENIANTVTSYSDFIGVFFTTRNLPASVAHFPDSIRRAALTSDTDSTIFTVQDWVQWYFGSVCFNNEATGVAATMIFLASQTITHVLAVMSANFGIEKELLHEIAMKNEFKFDVFVPTQVAKHYFACISCQEGNIFKELKMEIKGVHLKNSNLPKSIMSRAKDMMKEIMETIIDGKQISVLKYMTTIANIERELFASIERGSSEFFRFNQINTPESYKKSPEESPYSQYLMWNEVFGPKYGMVSPPPYTVMKISTELLTTGDINQWLVRMEDRELSSRMQKWIQDNRKTRITTFLIPDSIIQSHGIPKEIMEVLGARKIVLDNIKVFYLILETLGIFIQNKTKLVSDYY